MTISKLSTKKYGGGLAELKSRLLFLCVAILIYRIGAHIPIPGLDPTKLQELFSGSREGVLGLFNMFSGGALSKMTIFALGVMPYISASIIVQLMTAVVPSLEQLKKEGGEAGRRKITQYGRYFTVILASLHAFGATKYLVANGVVIEVGAMFYFVSITTLVTGSVFLMWLGEQITERGIGNGVSLIIFAGIVAGLPREVANTIEQVRQGVLQPLILILVLLLLVAVVTFIVFVERGQRKIAVHYAKRQQGAKVFAAQKSHLPMKINMAGVIPPIVATTLIVTLGLLAEWLGRAGGVEWLSEFGLTLRQGDPLYILIFAGTVIFFCFFYTALAYNPRDTAENLKKSGAFIPGIRPGEQTAQYIDKIMTRLTLVGGFYIALVALLPNLLVLAWHVPFQFGGTSLLITVVVVMDFIAQVQSYLMSSQYESLMKNANLKGNKTAANDILGGGPKGMI